jgi:AraC-like DNA-binding protein
VTELSAEYAALPHTQTPELTEALLRQLLGALLIRLARLPAPHQHPSPATEPYLAFRRELQRSFATTRSVETYAARLGYSPRTLTRACLAATGRTAKQLADARVALEAQRLLAHTDLPVSEIGRSLGFTEPTNFGKFFTRETGQTPGAFRLTQRY